LRGVLKWKVFRPSPVMSTVRRRLPRCDLAGVGVARYNWGVIDAAQTSGVARMKHTIDAIYEDGTFRPIQRDAVSIADGQRVRITIEDECEPEALRLAGSVYDGLSDSDINEIERIALARGNFFGARSVD